MIEKNDPKITDIKGHYFPSDFFDRKKVKNLVVMLHGWGSNGENFIKVASDMVEIDRVLDGPRKDKVLSDTYFVAPDAPYRAQNSGFQWWSLENRLEDKMFTGMQNATKILNHFIDQELKRFNLTDDRMALVGFSQGAMLALYAGLRRPKKCAAVVAYSGRVVSPESVKDFIVSRPEVCVIHGEADDVVPFNYFAPTVEMLKDNGVPVKSFAIKGLDHHIDMEGTELGARFIDGFFNKI